jgi:hypothetical protein
LELDSARGAVKAHSLDHGRHTALIMGILFIKLVGVMTLVANNLIKKCVHHFDAEIEGTTSILENINYQISIFGNNANMSIQIY